ncbi:MAG: S8 family serine peptidase [candidate division Zixibacteria bacterium]|nr:S8 family serine peptidase [candidate division Zixibacteria bacterium]
MKVVTCLFILFFLVSGVSVLAQDDYKITDISDFLRTNDVKEIVKPFHAPPPVFYQYVPDEIVIKLKEDIKPTEIGIEAEPVVTGCNSLDELNKKFQVKLIRREFPDPPARAVTRQSEELRKYYIIKFGGQYDLKEVCKAYLSSDCIEKAELIGVHPLYDRFPNDPYFLSDQWNFYNDTDHDVDATLVWEHETGDTDVILAVLDSGVQYNSRDLGGLSPYTDGNMWINWTEYNGTGGVDDDGNGFVDDWIGWDFVNGASPCYSGEDCYTEDNEPTDFNGHGTHVSGIMGAITNNNYMVAGLAGGWNEGTSPANGVKIMALRIGWSAPDPIYGEVGYVRMDFAAQAIYYAVNHGATAINCSWGSSNTGGLGAAVNYATSHGVLVVAAAGNDGNSSPDYLGTRTDVINVCATDSTDVKPSWSDYGTWVDIAAPGVDILSTYSYHYNPLYIAWISGTSQAAPHVTGAAGILKSYADTLTADQIKSLLLDYTDYIDDLNPAYAGLMGSGRLNVFKALDAVEAPTVTVIQPNGGEVLYIGQIYTIMWDAADNVGIVATLIEYSVNSGADWTVIADLEGNPGSFDWTVTGPASDQCRVKVTCTDAVGLSGSDMSDDDFCPPYKAVARTFSVLSKHAMPVEFALNQNYPNPFNPRTEIDFSLSEDAEVTLEIYNLLGQKVRTLIESPLKKGEHTAVWDSRDNSGNSVASGIYFYKLTANQRVATRKMVLLK